MKSRTIDFRKRGPRYIPGRTMNTRRFRAWSMNPPPCFSALLYAQQQLRGRSYALRLKLYWPLHGRLATAVAQISVVVRRLT